MQLHTTWEAASQRNNVSTRHSYGRLRKKCGSQMNESIEAPYNTVTLRASISQVNKKMAAAGIIPETEGLFVEDLEDARFFRMHHSNNPPSFVSPLRTMPLLI
jgi:hypothetical protein